MGMPRGKRGISGIIAKACDAASVPWGHVSSGCIYTGSRLDSLGFTEEDAPNFTFRQNNCSFYTGRKRLAKKFWLVTRKSTSGAFGFPSTNSITHVTITNYLTKVMGYSRLLDARNSISELREFVEASLLCWEMRIPFGIYIVTDPGSVTTREVVDLIKKNGLCDKEFGFFGSEDKFMRAAAVAPRSNCVMNSDKLLRTGSGLRRCMRRSSATCAIGRESIQRNFRPRNGEPRNQISTPTKAWALPRTSAMEPEKDRSSIR